MAKERLQDSFTDKRSSLTVLCHEIERSDNENDLKVAFNHLNEILEKLAMIAPLTEPKGISFAVLKEMKCSHKLGFYLNSELTPEEAINEYKRAVVKDLSIHIRKRYNIKHRMKTFEDNLFRKFFPQRHSQHLDLENGCTLQGQLANLSQSVLSPCRKRGLSEISQDGIVEYTEKNNGSTTGEIHSTDKGIGNVTKKRRCDSSTYKGRSPNFAQPRNEKNCMHFGNGKSHRRRKCQSTHDY